MWYTDGDLSTERYSYFILNLGADINLFCRSDSVSDFKLLKSTRNDYWTDLQLIQPFEPDDLWISWII